MSLSRSYSIFIYNRRAMWFVYHVIPRDFPETLSCNELCPSLGRKKEVEFLPFENGPVFQEEIFTDWMQKVWCEKQNWGYFWGRKERHLVSVARISFLYVSFKKVERRTSTDSNLYHQQTRRRRLARFIKTRKPFDQKHHYQTSTVPRSCSS